MRCGAALRFLLLAARLLLGCRGLVDEGPIILVEYEGGVRVLDDMRASTYEFVERGAASLFRALTLTCGA